MWTLIASFDGKDESSEKKTKLLKTGKSYTLGRKEQPLVINSKKISHDHGEFTVGKFTVDDVGDLGTRPTLQYNTKKKVAQFHRGGEEHSINPGSTCDLLDGDVLTIASNAKVTVRWESLCCYQAARGRASPSLESCASLGIHLTHTPSPNITHHLTNTYAVTTLHALSLVSATQFVKVEWLDEVIRLGTLPLNSDPTSGISLEQAFTLPPTSKYRPTFNTAVPSEQKTFKIWEPNEERLNMFNPYRFLCVGEGKREIDSDLRELLSRGGGKVEVFDVADGTPKWTKALSRGRAKVTQKLVLVANPEACEAAVGKDSWKELVQEANIFGLQFFSPQDILQVVLNTDTSVLDPGDIPVDPAPSTLTDFIPNTHPEEASLVPESEEPEPEKLPQRKLTRRVSSRQASQEPKPIVEEPPAPRRHLTRRAQPTGLPVITGLDDASMLLNNLPDTSVVAPSLPVDPSKPRSKLKRRVGVSVPMDHIQAMASNALVSGIEPETGEEPPLKKFKALFEASDPTRSGAESFVQGSGAFDEDELMSMANLGSQTQSEETQSGSKRPTRSGITALRAVQEEEEEESQMPIDGSGATALGKKRQDRSFDGDDVEMAGVEQVLNGASGSSSAGGPAAKKRAVPGNEVERATSKPPSLVAGPSNAAKVPAPTKLIGKKGAAVTAGAATGKPDTDSAFLKAIASTKRGKKTEDDFDRDFNKLKISKSDLRVDEAEQRPAWELLETFGDESNLRGNFMVIQDLDVFRADGRPGPRNRAVGNDPRWDGKPDFKKFKKQTTVARKKIIELIISDENDTGLGPGYWKCGSSPTRSEEDLGPVLKRKTQVKKAQQVQPKASRSKAKSQAMTIDDSDEEEAEIAPKEKAKRSKPPSKAEPPKKRNTRGASKVPDTPAPLFLDSDSDAAEIADEPIPGGTLDEADFDAGETLQASDDMTAAPARRSSRAPAAGKRKAAIIVDDDSDDGAVFGGFAKKRARRS
ncbi:proline-rich protein [Mycena vulgaris]|nr:proline-rich protein [Mycena vulgaris]